MEQMPKPYREEFENQINRAHEEALRDNAKIDELEMELREAKGLPQEEGITYESISPEKVSSLKLPEMKGKPFSEVIEYVKEKFGDKYIIPGEGYLRYLMNHPYETPEALKGIDSPISKNVRMAYFVGSMRRNMGGQMSVAGGIPPFNEEDKRRLHEWKNPGQAYDKNLYLNDNKWQSWEEDHLSLDTKFNPNYEIVLIEKDSKSSNVVEEKAELQKTVSSAPNKQTDNEGLAPSAGTEGEETEQSVEDTISHESRNAMELDYESIEAEKVKIFELPEMVGKPMLEVIKYVNEKFSDRYYVPGKRYVEYLNKTRLGKGIPSTLINVEKLDFLGNDSNEHISVGELIKMTGSDVVWVEGKHLVLIEKNSEISKVTGSLDTNTQDTLSTREKVMIEVEQIHTPELSETLARIREKGYLDTSFEGKEVRSFIMRPLSKDEAFAEYKKSGREEGAVVFLNETDYALILEPEVDEFFEGDIPYSIPQPQILDVITLNFNRYINDSDEAVKEMNELGVRPLTFEELIQYAVKYPAHQEENNLLALGSKYSKEGYGAQKPGVTTHVFWHNPGEPEAQIVSQRVMTTCNWVSGWHNDFYLVARK